MYPAHRHARIPPPAPPSYSPKVRVRFSFFFLPPRPVLAVVFPDKIQVGFLGKYLYCAAAFEGHFFAMMALDELMPQLVVLQFVYSRFADYLVAEGVVEVARAGNDVLYLVVRREEFAQRDGGAGMGRAVALFEPKFVTQDFAMGWGAS